MKTSVPDQPRAPRPAPMSGPPTKPVSTIYDVAAAAGVNASTVSRALNTPQRVSAATRSKVQKAAHELNYKAHVGASRLGGGGQRVIGLVMSGLSDPIQIRILNGIEQAASTYGCAVIASDGHRSAEQERAIGERLAAATDGVIFLDSVLAEEELVELSRLTDLVVVNRHVAGVATVGGAASLGMVYAVRYLAALGHRSIAFVTRTGTSPATPAETQDVEEQCAWSGIRVENVTCDGAGVEAGRRAARAVRATSCTAVVCAGDLLGIGVMQELQAADIQVPQEISVVGWGDIEAASLTTPPLSTIRPASAASGQLAVKSLVELWHRTSPAAVDVHPPELIIRGSSGAAPHPLLAPGE